MATERLPVSDIPHALRKADVNLSFQPLLQFRSKDGLRIGKVGDQVLSWHSIERYPGWAVFAPELKSRIELVLEKVPSAQFTRIGFRYVNALTESDHRVKGVQDLTLGIAVAGQQLESSLNLNYKLSHAQHSTVVKLATPELVEGLSTLDMKMRNHLLRPKADPLARTI
jgi:uncharacterized protein (TIGR04255 family)